MVGFLKKISRNNLEQKREYFYSAECIYRYLFDDYFYTEQHTALRLSNGMEILKFYYRKWRMKLTSILLITFEVYHGEQLTKSSLKEKLAMRMVRKKELINLQ